MNYIALQKLRKETFPIVYFKWPEWLMITFSPSWAHFKQWVDSKVSYRLFWWLHSDCYQYIDFSLGKIHQRYNKTEREKTCLVNNNKHFWVKSSRLWIQWTHTTTLTSKSNCKIVWQRSRDIDTYRSTFRNLRNQRIKKEIKNIISITNITNKQLVFKKGFIHRIGLMQDCNIISTSETQKKQIRNLFYRCFWMLIFGSNAK